MNNKKAPIINRCIAYFIDVVVIFIIVKVITPDQITLSDQVRYNATLAVVFTLYNLITLKLLKNQTLGKKLMSIKITDMDHHTLIKREVIWKMLFEKLNVWILLFLSMFNLLEGFIHWSNQSTIGMITYYLVSLPWIMFISFIYMLNNKDNQSLHDKYSGTRLVKTSN